MSRPVASRRLLAWSVAPALGLMIIGAAASQVRGAILVNESPSLPRGIYVRAWAEAPAQGSIVALDQPAVVRSYLAHLGMPPDVGLIKRVVALPGDPVCSVLGSVHVAGRTAPVTDADSHGLRLPVWRGCRSLRSDELFLLGDTPNSLDGRNFGPTARADIKGVYRRVMTW